MAYAVKRKTKWASTKCLTAETWDELWIFSSICYCCDTMPCCARQQPGHSREEQSVREPVLRDLRGVVRPKLSKQQGTLLTFVLNKAAKCCLGGECSQFFHCRLCYTMCIMWHWSWKKRACGTSYHWWGWLAVSHSQKPYSYVWNTSYLSLKISFSKNNCKLIYKSSSSGKNKHFF